MKTDKAKSVNRFFKKNLLSLIFLGILFTGLIAALIQIQIQSDTRSKASLTAVDLAVIPANQTVQPGQLVSFNLSINTHAHTVTAAQLELTFNNTLFDFVSFTPGNALNEILIAGVAFSNKVYLTLGTKPVLVNPGPPPVYEIHPSCNAKSNYALLNWNEKSVLPPFYLFPFPGSACLFRSRLRCLCRPADFRYVYFLSMEQF